MGDNDSSEQQAISDILNEAADKLKAAHATATSELPEAPPHGIIGEHFTAVGNAMSNQLDDTDDFDEATNPVRLLEVRGDKVVVELPQDDWADIVTMMGATSEIVNYGRLLQAPEIPVAPLERIETVSRRILSATVNANVSYHGQATYTLDLKTGRKLHPDAG